VALFFDSSNVSVSPRTDNGSDVKEVKSPVVFCWLLVIRG
jgi:hypothetical protein